jgi:hypothetical protein
LASSHGTDSTILAVHSSAPCSPWRNCDSVQFWLSTPKVVHSASPHFAIGVPDQSIDRSMPASMAELAAATAS